MGRVLAFLLPLAVGSALSAQNAPDRGPDEWTLERVTDAHYRVGFYNAEPPASGIYPRSLTMGEMTVDIHIHVTSGPEILTVTPPPGWVALPPELPVEDGNIGWVEVIYMQDWVGG